MKKDDADEKEPYKKSIESFNRRMQILGMFKGQESQTARIIYDRLEHAGDHITERSVERGLEMLTKGGYLEVNTNSKPFQWRLSKSKKSIPLHHLSDQEVLAIRLLEQFLIPILPPNVYKTLVPYFEAAKKQLKNISVFAPLRNWENKVRIIPPAQALLPPMLPPKMADKITDEQWQTHQQEIRDVILQALFENKQCQIEYQQVYRDDPVTWIIHPLVYVQRGPAFYLLCTINDYTDVRQLALHRMLSAKPLGDRINKPAGFNVDQEVERSQGMGGSGEPIRLVARFWKPAGSHLMETRLSADQTVDNDDDNHFRLTATVNNTAQLRWWLLSFGSKVEVLEPEDLRGEMAQNGYWMNRMYSTPKAPPTATPDSESEANG
ncbi:MAG: helix-turn-helix transcriptional regulator [Candidatus Competibacteraceae bacterium]